MIGRVSRGNVVQLSIIRTRTHGSTGKGQSTHVHQIANLPVLGAAQRRKLFSRMQYASRRYRREMQDGMQLRNSDRFSCPDGRLSGLPACMLVLIQNGEETALTVSNGDGMPRGRCQGPYGAALVWPRLRPGILAIPPPDWAPISGRMVERTLRLSFTLPTHTIPYNTS